MKNKHLATSTEVFFPNYLHINEDLNGHYKWMFIMSYVINDKI